MSLGLGFKGAILGIGEENIWGTKVAVTKFIELNSDGLTTDEDRLHSEAINGIYSDDDEISRSSINVSGEMEFEMRYEGMERILKHAMGSVATAETASFTITLNTNDYIDFIEDSGSELSVQLPAGTYIMGASSAIAGSLCALIKTKMEEVGDGTYTVTHNESTHIITIAVSGGVVSQFKMLGATGTNKEKSVMTTLGYTLVDQTLASSQVGETAVVPVYTHTFTLADALPTGLTMEVDRDVKAFTASGCKINTLTLSNEYGGFLLCKIGVIGKEMTSGDPTAQTLPTAELVNFTQGAVTYGGNTKYVKSLELTLNNNLSADRRFIGSRNISEPQRTAKIEVTGKIAIEFDSTSEYDDFREATSRSIVMTFTSTSLIKTGHYYTITINIPIAKLTAGVPLIEDEGVIQLDLPFKAYASDSSTREFNVTIKNSLSSGLI